MAEAAKGPEWRVKSADVAAISFSLCLRSQTLFWKSITWCFEGLSGSSTRCPARKHCSWFRISAPVGTDTRWVEWIYWCPESKTNHLLAVTLVIRSLFTTTRSILRVLRHPVFLILYQLHPHYTVSVLHGGIDSFPIWVHGGSSFQWGMKHMEASNIQTTRYTLMQANHSNHLKSLLPFSAILTIWTITF